MKSILYQISLSLLVATMVLSCSDNHKTESASHKEEAKHNGEIFIEPDDAKKFGLMTETVKMQTLKDIIRVSGRIMNSSSDESTIVAANPGVVRIADKINVGCEVDAGTRIATITPEAVAGNNPTAVARAAVNAAKREVDRLKPLFDERIVTRREYDAAIAAYQTALAAYSPAAASNSAVSPFKGIITSIYVKTGDYVEAGTPLAIVGRSSSLLLRADLPEKYRSNIADIESADFRTSYSDQWINIDSLHGKKNTADTSVGIASEAGYIPVYFTFANNGQLAAGDYVDVCLVLSSDKQAIAIPDEAIIEQMGNYFVYLKSGDHSYEKRRIERGQSNGTQTQITSGLREGDIIVTKGTTIVRLAETSDVIPEGHSHTH